MVVSKLIIMGVSHLSSQSVAISSFLFEAGEAFHADRLFDPISAAPLLSVDGLSRSVYMHAPSNLTMPSKNIDEVCLCMALRRASRKATRLYDELMKESGLKITQFSLLRNIERAGTINVTELAKKLDLERTAMGRNLDLLRRKGLIRVMDPEEDQRLRNVCLTEKGRQAQREAVPIWKRAQSEMGRRLKNGAFESLTAVLSKLSAA